MEKGELSQFPPSPGVYAVFDSSSTLQYIGLSRRVGPDGVLQAANWNMQKMVSCLIICRWTPV
jgi:hypothetical protein